MSIHCEIYLVDKPSIKIIKSTGMKLREDRSHLNIGSSDSGLFIFFVAYSSFLGVSIQTSDDW